MALEYEMTDSLPPPPPGFSELPPPPPGFSEVSTPQPQGMLDRLIGMAKDYAEKKRPKTIKEALLKGIGNAGLGVPAVGDIPGLPNQTVAGAAKGISDLALGPAQFAAHVTGVGTGAMDNAVNKTRDYFRDNFDPASAGEFAGQSVAALVPMGGAGRLARLAQYGATPALATPEADLKPGQYTTRKLLEAGGGLVLGGAAEVGSKILNAAKPALRTIARAERPEEIINSVRSGYTGTPEAALRQSTRNNLSQDIAKAREVYAPGDKIGQDINVDLIPAADVLDETLAKYEASGRITHPEQISLLKNYAQRWRDLGTTTWEDAVGILSDLKADVRDLNIAGARRVDKAPFDKVTQVLTDSLTNASPEAMAHQQAGNQSWVDNVTKHFTPTAKAMRNTPDEAHAQEILAKLRPGGTKRMEAGKVSDLAKAGGAEPIIEDWLTNALERSGGRPAGYEANLRSGMEVLKDLDPDIAARILDSLEVARYSRPLGALINAGASKVGGPGATIAASFNPAYSGPGLVWGGLQSPAAKKAASMGSKIPVGQELNAYTALMPDYLLERLGWNQSR